MGYIVWYAAGLAGSWFTWKCDGWMKKDERKCPSPKVITQSALFAVLGPITWFPALIYAVVWGIEYMERKQKVKNWWNSPICGKKED